MEILFEALFQLVGEILVTFLEHIWRKLKRTSRRSKSETNKLAAKAVIFLFHLIFGGFIGFISVKIITGHYIQNGIAQVAYLIIFPFIAGALMHLIGKKRKHYGKQTVSLENFYTGFAFAFGFALVRFLFAA